MFNDGGNFGWYLVAVDTFLVPVDQLDLVIKLSVKNAGTAFLQLNF